MSQIDIKSFILQNYWDPNFDITDFFKINGYASSDQDKVYDIVKQGINDVAYEGDERLKNFCLHLQAGDFMILNNDASRIYWDNKRVEEHILTQKREAQNDNTRASKRLKDKKAENITKLAADENPVTNKLKLLAQKVLDNRQYNSLDTDEKNSASNGLNSILDLSNSSNNINSQKSLFSMQEWKDLLHKYDQPFEWSSLDPIIKRNLKELEKITEEEGPENAYRRCLQYQLEFCLTKFENYYKIYLHLLDIMIKNPSWLEFDNKNNKFSEEDYVVKIWGPIFEKIFENSSLSLKWGETVWKDSTKKKEINCVGQKNVIGDKVDLRIGNDHIDLINVEFKKNCKPSSYHDDHRKILRESKIMSDKFYHSSFLRNEKKKKIKSRCIQICGKNGEIMEQKIVENGLYVARRLGGLSLPSSPQNLRKARTVIQRLQEMKDYAIYQTRIYCFILEKERIKKEGMRFLMNQHSSSSHGSDCENDRGEMRSWVRPSWFPPRRSSK